MKRSKVIEIIGQYLADYQCYDGYGTYESKDFKYPASYLLDELEEAGMLPPRTEITGNEDPNKHIYVHKWENEDE